MGDGGQTLNLFYPNTPSISKRVCLLTPVDLAKGVSGILKTSQGLPVPYANLYLPSLETGTLSHADRRFTLGPALFLKASDTVVISAIGYETIRRSATNLSGEVVLTPIAYELAQAEVSATSTAFSKKREYGFNRRGWFVYGGFSWAANQDALGSESGVLLDAPADCRLEQLTINLRSISRDTSNQTTNRQTVIGFVNEPREADSVRFEINVYTVGEDGLPDRPIQLEPIYWTVSTAARRKVTLDLADAQLPAVGPVAVTLEGITNEGQGVSLWMPASLKQGVSYTKYNDGRWLRSEDTVSMWGEFGCLD